MEQICIEINQIDPRQLLGDNDTNLALIKAHYQQLKIVSRGHQIIAFGQTHWLEDFKLRIELLIKQISYFNKIDTHKIQAILDSKTPKDFENLSSPNDIILHGVSGKSIFAKTENQKYLVELIEKNDMIFACGPAGTGKTYTSIALAVKYLKNKQVKRIILTRPAVEAGENLGFLPGDMKEKLDPYMQPLYDALMDMIPSEKLQQFLEKGVIQIVPLAFMRGRTLDNAFVILDEAQNTTQTQMKMFLTRMGSNAKFIITGDPSQIDLPKKTTSGLKQAMSILKHIKGIGLLYLNESDVIRHPLVKKVIQAYENIPENSLLYQQEK